MTEKHEQLTNNDLAKELLNIRSGLLDIKEKHESLDNFLNKGWKLIALLVTLFSVASYSIAVYHHESSLKPFLFDIVKAIFGKLGGV